MTAPIMPQRRIGLARRYAILARVAVWVARPLSMLPPHLLCRILTLLVKGTRPPIAADVLSWRDAVNSVSRRCAGEGCLQRSVAVMLMGRFHGAPPAWKTGFRPNPFVAHAWVEVGGVPIGEPKAVAHFHAVLAVKHR
ncbi:Transglutaminase-like superfamily protein [Sinosporangium album]|uniref:Transglutaminase-like superfamily protein n=1 Tax=Sinosporangium album TaxID=504805 RepID=A0A1G8K500_9ACTN|nr:lasso peptide biosynthesis B2 protein [Sinosporangium album]SDI37890.1 Transglutaminase-like superfamily protein [Sinosporangium album]